MDGTNVEIRITIPAEKCLDIVSKDIANLAYHLLSSPTPRFLIRASYGVIPRNETNKLWVEPFGSVAHALPSLH